MIKVDLDATLKGKTKVTINGSIEVRGKVNIVAHEIWAIINDFKETCPEALEIALTMICDDIDDEEEE